MPAPLIPPDRMARLQGYGRRTHADGYLYRPTNLEEIREIFVLARESGHQVVLRGAGRSYGDANIAAETIVLDITRMRRILSWNPETGVIDCEGGVTIEQLWRTTIEDSYWPPVVSGTMYPTLAGALAMNIHGKNNFCAGTLGEHVLEIDVLYPTGKLETLTREQDRFYDITSSAGSLGVITRVKLKTKRIESGDVKLLSLACKGWEDQFRILQQYEDQADYMVSWVDCFARGKGQGRGQIHIAWYPHELESSAAGLRPEAQDLPDTIMGFWPKSTVWRVLKLFNNRFGMNFVNSARHNAASALANGKMHWQSLVGFSFLLDYVPNWRNAYLPGGFIQYQSFVPREKAHEVFAAQLSLQQKAGLVSFLGVLKRHRADNRPFLFSHAVDGYSLALDFKVTTRNWAKLQSLCHDMNEVVVAAGGRFYFAKDSTLRPKDIQASLGTETLDRFRQLKQELDPANLLTSGLAQRLLLG
ncbi:FAD-binding oxidoreductase [soil metagenome]